MWKHNKKVPTATLFSSKEETRKFLQDLFAYVDEFAECNIYVHQINDYRDDFFNVHGVNAIKKRVSGILKHGLNINKYSTLSGTSTLLGTTATLDAEKVFAYDYYKGLSCKALCIIAIPKYVYVDGKKIEYSSYKGQAAWDFPEDLTKEYVKELKSRPEFHHYKCSLFDAIKNYRELPGAYLLGIVQLEEEIGRFSFVSPNTHLSMLEEDEVEDHYAKIENEIKALYDKYGTTKTETIIVKAYKELEQYYQESEDLDY